MYQVMTRHFEGVEKERFLQDLDEKNWVILLEHTDGRLAGFSTLLIYDTQCARERLTVVYSGDTIVDRTAWGSSALARAWIRTVLDLKNAASADRLLWLLIVSGFRTYRFLPVFFNEFFPRYDHEASDDTRALVRALAQERFGSNYDAERGTVRFGHPQRLLPELAQIPTGRRKSQHIELFERLNPEHAAGEELVCLTEIDSRNLTRAGRRMLGISEQ